MMTHPAAVQGGASGTPQNQFELLSASDTPGGSPDDGVRTSEGAAAAAADSHGSR